MSKAAELAALIGSGQAQGDRNFIINGAHVISQRGTSFTGQGGTNGGVYFTDRWYTYNYNLAGRYTATREAITDLSGFTTALKLDCTTADTSIAADEQLSLIQAIEAQNLQSLSFGTSNAKRLVFSFYAKANATKTYVAELYKEDTTTSSQSHTFTVTSSWQRFEIPFNNTNADSIGDIDNNNGTGLYWVINLHAGSNLTSGTINSTWLAATQANRAPGCESFFDSTDNTFFITGAQLEVGSGPATAFEHEDFGTTLKKCQRYFVKFATGDYYGNNYSTGHSFTNIDPPVPMRATPTTTYSDARSTSTTDNTSFNSATRVSFYQQSQSAYISNPTADAEL